MKESIEIPFGAKDSELCGWEYTIPKGFVASIENGKIIVKKDDDRDEKIRKEILEYFQQFENEELRGVDISDWIAWLEKQVEQKPTIEMKSPEESLGIDSDTYNKIVDECIYGEQKSAWSEEDENRFNNLKWLVERSNEGNGTKEGFIKFIDRLKKRWKPSEEQIQALEYQVNSTYIGSWQYKASKELLEQLKKL